MSYKWRYMKLIITTVEIPDLVNEAKKDFLQEETK